MNANVETALVEKDNCDLHIDQSEEITETSARKVIVLLLIFGVVFLITLGAWTWSSLYRFQDCL